MLYSGILTAFLAFPLLANAFHNVTYNDNDPAVVYNPAADWIDWPPAGCLSWPGGQYTHNGAGSITLKFYGVAVYAYGLFDDPTNPIYTIQVDGGNAVELGRAVNPNPQSCDPIFVKTGLTANNHTITLQMTDTRPGDVQDLSFQGFIVTVPDPGDAPATTNTTTNTNSDSNSSKQAPVVIIAAAAGGVVIVCFAVAVFCFCRRKNRKNNVASQQMTGSAVPLVVGGYSQPPVDPSIPAPTPYILPPSREASPYYPPTSSPWSPSSNEQQSYYGGSSSGPSHVQSHVSYAPSGGYSSPPPSNDGYGRPYGAQTTPVNGGQPFYPNPANPGLYGDAQQQQYNPAQNQYQTPVQQQSQYSWNPTVAAPPGLAQSEVSYLSREEGSSSVARTEEPHHPSPSVRYTKGAVDHNAAPVVRNENAELQKLGPKRESHGGEAPPPEYGAF